MDFVIHKVTSFISRPRFSFLSTVRGQRVLKQETFVYNTMRQITQSKLGKETLPIVEFGGA